MTANQPPPARDAAERTSTCYLERSEVRQILIGQPDENLHITEAVLAEIDALPIFNADDFAPPPPAPDAVREARRNQLDVLRRYYRAGRYDLAETVLDAILAFSAPVPPADGALKKYKCSHCGEVSDVPHDGACGVW